ncbi:MAG TPA: gamma-glutamyl-gamma-aminobutyrate hydrolase family protein, partial [Candidatus Baltobacteraceae bacterium]|nr:gamma-glutamyl-gamma-aminobutyrate hydrolase family protein [Candidatus Baltobacteraceae bacterium]
MKIGLSYDPGSPKYRLYTGALMAAAEQSNIDVQPFWLAGADQALNTTALQTIDALLLTGGADVEPARYGQAGANGISHTDPSRDAVEWTVL